MRDEVTHKILPGRGIGPFVLGSPINPIVVEILLGGEGSDTKVDIGCDTAGKKVARGDGKSLPYGGTVNVLERWCSGELCCMELPSAGLRLYFCRKYQYLVGVEVYDVSRLSLSLGGLKQNRGKQASNEMLTYGDFYDAFGPTVDYPANIERREKALVYPGMLVLFEWDPEWGEGTDWLKRAQVREIVVMDGRIEAVDKVEALRTDVYAGTVHDRNNDGNEAESRGSSVAKAVMDVYRQLDGVKEEEEECVPSCVVVVLGMGILVVDQSASSKAFSDPEDDMVRFGDSHQEVLTVLGEPDAVMNKCGQKQDEAVWNYFTRGIDVVFDRWRHMVTMIVVHTNPIAHAEFGNYYKCFFEIVPSMELGDDLCSRMQESMSLTDKQEGSNKNDDDGSSCAWVSAGSSPSLGSNFGPDIAKEERIQKKQKKKKKKPLVALNKSTSSESSEGEHGSGDLGTRTFLDYTNSLDDFMQKLGDCVKPAIIYWDSLSENQSSRQQLGQTHLYKFKNIHAEFTKEGEVAALYLFKD
eukprot:jgi/Picsp_1/2069/NSC_05534-R1_upf0183 protein c16orf70-like